MYNNNLIILAGQVCAALAADGSTWEDLIEERIFTPLGMSSSTFIYRDVPDLVNYATPYVRDDLELVPTPPDYYS